MKVLTGFLKDLKVQKQSTSELRNSFKRIGESVDEAGGKHNEDSQCPDHINSR